ncbi:hypothetical protein F5Y03DRAFT_341383 [Xylaria venustula]|nr:hypothetical protein F5Y03DRAFT_341383 [Xylaria venustula]
MLRGATAVPPPALEAEDQPHNPRVLQTRHSGVYGPQTLTSEPCDEPSPKSIASPVTNSVHGSTSSTYRQHQRQQSAPSFAARRPNIPSLPPPQGQNNKRYSQGMPLTGDARGGGNSPGRHGGWRSGTSTPPSVEYDASPFPRQPRTPVDTTPKSTTQQSRFGFLASSVSAFTSRMTSPTQQAPAARTDDELCDLDIEAALFPPTPLSPLDGSGDSSAFSPAAYKNLQANATGLLHRMQDAYRQRTAALRQLQAEREAQAEEAEEMELRTRNFRAQLEAMAAKAAEQEKEMQRLVAELQAERRERARYHYDHGHSRVGEMMDGEGEETVVEDLCVDEDDRKRWRASNSTVKSDLSIDTDGFDSVSASVESESLFSRSRSPTATCATSTETDSVVDMPPPSALLHPRAAAGTPKLSKSTPQPQLTTFQRLVKGISPGGGGENGGGGVDGCRNCRGQDASVAWDTVSLLRDENIALKQRVAQLDVVIEGALDVVNGFKI